jgi:hypothetical protein
MTALEREYRYLIQKALDGGDERRADLLRDHAFLHFGLVLPSLDDLRNDD